jgi:hypothetical protein
MVHQHNEWPCKAARSKIQELQYFEDFEDGKTVSFFPLDRLRSFLKRDVVKSILECGCPVCQEEKIIFGGNTNQLQYLDAIIGNQEQYNRTKSAYLIYSLLIYIEHPMAVIGFLEGQCTDFHVQTTPSFSKERLKTDYCSRLWERVDAARFDRFAIQFIRAIPEFAVPRMDSITFTRYTPNRILPFIEEKKIGIKTETGEITSEGANGKVYRFRIYDEYQHFKVCLRDINISTFTNPSRISKKLVILPGRNFKVTQYWHNT